MYKNFEKGRSMIEMLGVLAIIGVLSVGGIAGYSKAMEKFKFNKLISEYTMLVQGMLPYISKMQNSAEGENGAILDGLAELAVSLNLIPPAWTVYSSKIIKDNLGNNLHFFVRDNRLVLDIYLADKGKTQQYYKLCQEFTVNFIQPLHSSLYYARIYGGSAVYYGDKYCSNTKKCLKDMTLSEINSFCMNCASGSACALGVELE